MEQISESICESAQLLTETEAARLLKISRKSVKNILPRIRLSERRTRYRLTDVLNIGNNPKFKAL